MRKIFKFCVLALALVLTMSFVNAASVADSFSKSPEVKEMHTCSHGSSEQMKKKKCEPCRGTGVCHSCGGDGTAKKLGFPKRKCSLCLGSGRCCKCHGKGVY